MDPTLDYSYDLPPELIAQEPAPRRPDARLLVVGRHGGGRRLQAFSDLPDLLHPGDLLVVNDSRVLPARLWTRRVDTGGQIELLLLAPAASGSVSAWQALARPARRLRTGLSLSLHDPRQGFAEVPVSPLQIVDCGSDGEVTVITTDGADLATLAERYGEVPLPPYIHRDRAAPDAAAQHQRDRERYQTVYARADASGAGSAAAPTAGLHLDAPLLARLVDRGVALTTVTLHVGPGTFRPPTAEQIAAGRLHPEAFSLPSATSAALAACRARGGRVIAVGTTSLRVLASVQQLELPLDAPVGTRCDIPGAAADPANGDALPVVSGQAEREAAGWAVHGITRLFIQPPDAVTAASGLVTNFHLPGSSLLRLVAAFAGELTWRAAYREAIEHRLRFFSYGDAMLILPQEDVLP